MTIRFTVRTDCHVHDKAPQSRVDNYLDTCITKLHQVADHARKNRCDAVIDNGDFFHAKAATKNSHEMVRRVIDLHREFYPCPVYENPGNHDFPYNNVDYVERQPLGVLFSAGIFQRLENEVFEDEDGLKVRVVGFPFKTEYDPLEFDIERGDEDVLIAAVHHFASPEGGEIYGGADKALSYLDLADCSPDFFIFGHWHIDQGIQTVKDTTFMNLGSMTRGSLTKDNLDRTPRFGFIEVEKAVDGSVDVHAEAVVYDVESSEDVFDLERHERLEKEQQDIEQFVSTLVQTAEDDGEENILEVVKEMSDFEGSVRKKAIQYLEDVMQ